MSPYERIKAAQLAGNVAFLDEAVAEIERLRALIALVENAGMDRDEDPCCPWCGIADCVGGHDQPSGADCPAFTARGVVR